MKEKLFYLINDSQESRKLFIHAHLAELFNGNIFLFLNPLFDEKKRAQKFMADTARALCKENNHVFRFDYFGTGDSGGELYKFDFEKVKNNISFMCEHIFEKYNPNEIKMLGVRFGADLAILFSQNNSLIKQLLLIEPIINGSRYLIEQRMRRKVFHKLNKMSITDSIEINGESFEDHQGYPLSSKVVEFLEKWNSTRINLIDKNITLFKLNAIFSKKAVGKLKGKLSQQNRLCFKKIDCPGFWSSLEPIDTAVLTHEIVTSIKKDK